MAPQNADQKPPTRKPSTNEATNQNSSPLITRVNKPSVRMVMGRVMSTSSGRIRVLTRPSTSAVSSAMVKLSTLTEGST